MHFKCKLHWDFPIINLKKKIYLSEKCFEKSALSKFCLTLIDKRARVVFDCNIYLI